MNNQRLFCIKKGPKTAGYRAKIAPRQAQIAQAGPKSGQDCPGWLQEAAKSTLRAAKTCPKIAQDHPKNGQERPKSSPRAAKAAPVTQACPKTAPSPLQDRHRPPMPVPTRDRRSH